MKRACPIPADRRAPGLRFWPLALLWLPAGVAATALVRFGADGRAEGDPGTGLAAIPVMLGSLLPLAPCGLPLALGCRQLWRLGYRAAAWVAGFGLGAVTVAAALPAGLLGPVMIAVHAATLSVPVWIACVWIIVRRK